MRFEMTLQRAVLIAAVAMGFMAFALTFPRLLTPEQIAANKQHEATMIRLVCSGATQGPPAYSEELCKDEPKH